MSTHNNDNSHVSSHNWALKDALLGAGVKKPPHVPTPKRPANNRPVARSSKPFTTAPKDGYIVLPFHKLRDGSVFVPIEKMGKKFYYNSRVNGLPSADRRWAVTKDLFIKDSNARSMSVTTGATAIFSLFDWCIVKVGSNVT